MPWKEIWTFFWVGQAKRIRQQSILQKFISSPSFTAGEFLRAPQQCPHNQKTDGTGLSLGTSGQGLLLPPHVCPHPHWHLQSLQKHLQSSYQVFVLAHFYVNLNPVSNSNLDSVFLKSKNCLVHGWCSICVWWVDKSLCLAIPSGLLTSFPSPIFNCNWLWKPAPQRGQFFQNSHRHHPSESCWWLYRVLMEHLDDIPNSSLY